MFCLPQLNIMKRMENISFQTDLRPLLPTVLGPKDYHDFRDRLEQMDRLLLNSDLEYAFLARHVAAHFPRVFNLLVGWL